MADRYQQLVSSGIGRQLAGQLGLPAPVELRRYAPADPVTHGPVLFDGAPGGRLTDPVLGVLKAIDADVRTEAIHNAEQAPDERFAALVYDATGIERVEDLREVYTFFHNSLRHLKGSGRLLVMATPPETLDDVHAATAQQALEGFVRSAGKEMRGGATANLLHVAPDAEEATESTLRFLLSGRSAYVSGQVLRVDPPAEGVVVRPDDWARPLDGKVAVVTGAAQGIGAAIAEVLARDGATVVCLDLPSQGDDLTAVANRIGGTTLQLDITADDAPERLASHLDDRHGGVDLVIHNAGITRDKTLAGMSPDRWDSVLAVNLLSQQRIDEALLDKGTLNEPGARIVAVSSVSGIAGNRGQTNYAASKAGVIGRVQALAPTLRDRRGTINAVAPGFIETDMTGAMPLVPREVGRRMNSLNQGGEPRDVAETIAWLAQPASGGVNGRVVRVCGQQLIGA